MTEYRSLLMLNEFFSGGHLVLFQPQQAVRESTRALNMYLGNRNKQRLVRAMGTIQGTGLQDANEGE